MKPDPDALRDLGESTTNVATAWAGATDYLSRGLKTWTRMHIGSNRTVAVRVGLATVALVVDSYVAQNELPPRKYIDDMIAAIKQWLDDQSRENTELVRSSLDVTRSAHAWQREADVAAFWILEAVDHLCLAVWSGERASYIVPMDFATCSARSVTCVLHAMLDAGVSEDEACAKIADAVRAAAGQPSSSG
jgi:hypothetical protein